MRNRIPLLLVLVGSLTVLLLGCSLGGGGVSRTTATPTKTLRPLFTSTVTPTATPLATDTPVREAAPTATPLPPTDTLAPTEPPSPTASQIPPTEVLPTDTPVPPSDTPSPPTNTPQPRPTNTPVPPTNTPKPQVDFKVKEIVAFEDGSLTATGLHNVYFTVIDASGAPLDGIILRDVNNQSGEQVITGNKGSGKTEFTMWAADYRFQVVGNVNGQAYSSEITHLLSVLFGHAIWDDLIRGGICADVASCEALGPIHYSYNVTFQRTW